MWMMMRWCKYASAASHHGLAQGATRRKATFYTHIRTEEEDADEREADSAKEEADEVRITKTTPNFGRKTEAIEEPSEEGGAFIPVRADKTRPNANIAKNSATTKKSAERKSTNRLPQADNSQITCTTPTKKIVAECS